MNIRINLDENDITKIIAQHFGVKVHEVTVTTETETRGCGMAETTVHVATATIKAKEVHLFQPEMSFAK